MAKRVKKAEPTDTFTMEVNGHKLAGRKTGGQWEWVSSVPGLAKKHQGSAGSEQIISEFMAHAIVGAVGVATAKMFAASFDRLHAEQEVKPNG